MGDSKSGAVNEALGVDVNTIWIGYFATKHVSTADLKHLGGRIGITSVLHTWDSAVTHHPHVHMIVPGSRPTASAGCRAGRDSSSRCAYSPACSGDCSFRSSSPRIKPAA